MKTHTPKKNLGLKSLILLPLLAILLYSFSTQKKEYKTSEEKVIVIEIDNNKIIKVDTQTASFEELKLIFKKIREDNKDKKLIAKLVSEEAIKMGFITDLKEVLIEYGVQQFKITGAILHENKISEQELKNFKETVYNSLNKSKKGASREQMKEYNALAKKYNAVAIKKRIIKRKDLERLETIYRLMSNKQKSDAEPFPECLPSKPNKESTNNRKVYAQEYLDGAQRNNKKAFVLEIINNKIKLNNKFIKLKDFARKLDEYTKNWEETDYTSAHPSILIKGSSKEFLTKVEEEFQKTRYAKANGGFKLLPPPPPPPPALDMKNPPPPPPPPAPPVPLDHVIEMAKEGATFYYNDKKITSDEAINIVKKNKSINISTNTNNGTHIVKLSKSNK